MTPMVPAILLQASLGGRHDTRHAGIGFYGHPQRPAKGLEYRLRLMVRIAPLEVVDMQRDQRMIDEALEKFIEQVDIELTDTRAGEFDIHDQSRPARAV